ncbi:AI-2E family transporter [Sphingomonas sp. ABOLD]|uniref:Putative PurR-regulated permease PerM n=1 Tax=Sphingomonas trueperi TaxID=53317 RepID=A0A7X5Y1I6_9SPHN|nr:MULTISPECIES: AI-2E family transporter [Sphingomonas]NJB99284.1 putative PurR-regulated permease PerM [Sphingomonas trueperi]RSV40704.1 AI-2E family transporter [Sphingomonas sp. ABOLE]RSV48591.1 AI-2E family transporter [Sphingomonas sp. ABOLD]
MTFARAFPLSLLGGVTLAFLWLVTPFSGAILWAVIAAVLFDPLNARLVRAMPGRRNVAILVTLLAIIALFVVPAMLLGGALVAEAKGLYARVQGGDIDVVRLVADLQRHLPAWARHWLADIGLGDINGVRATLSRGLADGFQAVAARIVRIGQGTLGFFLQLGVMLYLTFFLLRDGRAIAARIERALPVERTQRVILVARFVTVIRATIKGSLIVAALQGITGGLIFWALGIPGALLWGVAMGFFSLFPAIGTGLIWVPMTLYLLATGAVWQATLLFACGFIIISSVDNVVRPILVGHDAQMPDYIVLIATLGGFELMGFNGFVVGPIIAALFLAAWEAFSLPAAGGEPATG